MKECIVLIGPPGSGKSTWAMKFIKYELQDIIYINQDTQGKKDHKDLFDMTVSEGKFNIIVDRMNFNKEQRQRYLAPAKAAGYKTRIIVLHEPRDVCYDRIIERQNHPTIAAGDTKTAGKVLDFFFKNYERPTPDEADEIQFLYPEGPKSNVVIVDLDGTLCNIEHRLHLVQGEGKKDWTAFFDGIKDDKVNEWCREIIKALDTGNSNIRIIYCSGRGEEYRENTVKWLKDNLLYEYCNEKLYMRARNDFRSDDIIKEQILDYELLTKYNILFTIDDRKQVCDMWRRRGLVCLQCAPGEF